MPAGPANRPPYNNNNDDNGDDQPYTSKPDCFLSAAQDAEENGGNDSDNGVTGDGSSNDGRENDNGRNDGDADGVKDENENKDEDGDGVRDRDGVGNGGIKALPFGQRGPSGAHDLTRDRAFVATLVKWMVVLDFYQFWITNPKISVRTIFHSICLIIVLDDIYSSITMSYTINTLNQCGRQDCPHTCAYGSSYTRYVNGFVHIEKLDI
ncbi:hypothetical protein HOY80DRAFT_999487 [Tuber brumale]|nr:hypothetical protein HOY80DRAFT_999487 [Tuber brumale]